MRRPYSHRRAEQRERARQRAESWLRVPMSPATRQESRQPGRDLLIGLVAASVLVHASVVVFRWITPPETKVAALPAKIELAEKPPEPEPEPVREEPAPEPAVAPPPPPPKPKAVKPPPVEAPPSVAAPRRIVGLSLESTGEGGDGPPFATGNTNSGETERVAVDPRAVPAEAPPAIDPPAPTAPTPNRSASNIPGAGRVIRPPTRLGEIQPAYPELLRAQGVEADVQILVSIDASGRVVEAKVVKSSGHPEFDGAALAAARREKYEPATRDGAPFAYSIKFTTRFRLDQP